MINFKRSFDVKIDKKSIEKMDATFKAMKEEMSSDEVGYYKLPVNSKEIINRVQNLKLVSFSQIVVIGIGGSSLGIKAIDQALRVYNKNVKEILYLENSDPVSISMTLQRIKKDEALFFVISKSGATIETTSMFKTVLGYLEIDLCTTDTKRIFAITDEHSSLSYFAKHYNIKEFNIPKNVGGRFSVLSAVGIVPLMLAGYDMSLVLKGAQDFAKNFFGENEYHLLEKAYYLSENSEKTPINVLFSYADGLKNFTKWYVQLWAESLGKINKDFKHVGLTPVGLIGSVDQHSFLQLIIEGTRDKTVTFIRINDFKNVLTIPNISLFGIEKTDFINTQTFNTLINAQCDATMQSLIDSKVSTDIITLDKISPENIGALIMYYELLTSAVGSMTDINTYDQPGVELGKKILHKNLNKKTKLFPCDINKKYKK